jgi:hypothetical protein
VDFKETHGARSYPKISEDLNISKIKRLYVYIFLENYKMYVYGI